MTVFENATLLDATGVRDDGWLVVDGPSIAEVGQGTAPRGERVDLHGRTLVPGFIDLHGHGAGGAAFDDAASDPTAIERVLAVHRAHGTTRSVLSLVANPPSQLAAALRAIAADPDPTILGVHLEGPFLSPHRSGAHAPEFLRDPDPATVAELLAAGGSTLRQVTIAPELPGALDAIRAFVASGVCVAVGHTEADYATASAAFDAGASILTHAFNAMPGILGREPGPLGAAMDDRRVTMELIADGRHVHPSNIALLFRAAPDRVALITDAMAATGQGDGRYRLGTLDVDVTDGRATVVGTGALAGSTLTQDVALRVALDAGVPPVEAVAALTLTPARALGLDGRHGRLNAGYAADLVALDDDWRVREVWIDGAPRAS